jgi:uncharacterized protein YuzE
VHMRVAQRADAIYINLSDPPIQDGTEVADDIVVDCDDQGRILGIEILDASVQTDDPHVLKQFSFELLAMGDPKRRGHSGDRIERGRGQINRAHWRSPYREPFARVGAGFLRFDVAVACRRVRLKRFEQGARGGGDVGDGAVEGGGVGLRGPVEAGELAHELQGRGAHFFVGRRRVEVEQGLDVAAHGRSRVRGGLNV